MPRRESQIQLELSFAVKTSEYSLEFEISLDLTKSAANVVCVNPHSLNRAARLINSHSEGECRIEGRVLSRWRLFVEMEEHTRIQIHPNVSKNESSDVMQQF